MGSMPDGAPRILQIGFGGFGPTHLDAWRALGLADRLTIADPDPGAQARCRDLGLPAGRIVADYRVALDDADAVDLVAPTDQHCEIACASLDAGCDLFIEKPMTATLEEAETVARLAREKDRVVQVGFYFRAHPLAQRVHRAARDGCLGDIRYVSARFHGFKRARGDSGVVHNDAVHFIDQINWTLGELPEAVDAVVRDHFGRGRDDFALIRLFYPGGAVASIEAGCIQPGRWNDNIVPGATQTKEFTVAGSLGAAEIDYMVNEIRFHAVHHELIDGLWRPVNKGVEQPHTPVAEPVAVVRAELETFLGHVTARTQPEAGADNCGVAMARILDAIFAASDSGGRVGV